MSVPVLTEEQQDIVREASAYRFPRWSIGLGIGDKASFELQIRAVPINRNRAIWGPRRLGTGTFDEMEALRKTTTAEYNRLTKGSQ